MTNDLQKELEQRSIIINAAKSRDGYVFMTDSAAADEINAVKASRVQTIHESDLADDGSDTNLICGEGIIHWDGYNHCAVIFASGTYEVDLEMVADSEAINELERAIESRKLGEETTAGKRYRSGIYDLLEPSSEDRWEEYSMRKVG